MERALLFLLLALLPLANLNFSFGSIFLNSSEILVVIFITVVMARNIVFEGTVRLPRKLRGMAICAVALALAVTLIGFFTGNLATAIRLAVSVLFSLFLAGASARYGPDIWTRPVVIGVSVAMAIAFGHLIGVVPLFEFERQTVGIASSGFLEVGYTGLVSARGEYGILLLLGLAAAMIGMSGRFKWVFLLAVLIAGLITISRSTWLALGATCVVMGILVALPGKALAGRIKNLLFFGLTLALIAIPAALMGFFTWLQERFEFLVGLRVSSFDNRLRQFSHFFSNADEYFWFGGGSADFVASFGYAIHNTQMSVYLAFGFLPALLYGLLFLGAIFKTVICVGRTRDSTAKRQASILLAAMLGCFIEASLYPKGSSMIMWALIGIAWGHTVYLGRSTLQPQRNAPMPLPARSARRYISEVH